MKIIVPKEYKNKCIFSSCKKYRYYLERSFKENPKSFLVFIMLNPSTADEKTNDPTVLRCQNHALNKKFDGFIVLNLFAFRSTEPKNLKTTKNPVGILNDKTILKTLKNNKNIICAWGNHGSFLNRSEEIKNIFKEKKIKTKAFEITKLGEPKHPLYISYGKKLINFV